MLIQVSLSEAKPYKVAIIDGRPDATALVKASVSVCDTSLKVPRATIKTYREHGTNVALTVMKGVRKDRACLAWYTLDSLPNSIRQAVGDGASLINVSLGGKSFNKEVLDKERFALLYAMVRGVKVVVSAGNESLDINPKLCEKEFYLGCHAVLPNGLKKFLGKNLFFVGHNKIIYGINNKQTTSNKFTSMYTIEEACSDEYTKLCGTSQSAAVFTNKILLNELNK